MNRQRLGRIAVAATLVWVSGVAAVNAQFYELPAGQVDEALALDAAVGDLNGDGKADLVRRRAPVGFGQDAVWEVRLNDGNGNFVTAAPLGTDIWRPVIADADGDGHADIVFPSQAVVNVFWGDGLGNFGPPTTVGGFTGARTLAVGDLNHDRTPDLVVAAENGLFAVAGGHARQFATPSLIAPYHSITDVAIGKVNEDGHPDLLVVNPSLTFFAGHGDLTFHAILTDDFSRPGGRLAVGDMNGDGRTDAVLTPNDAHVTIVRGTPFGPVVSQIVPDIMPAFHPAAITDVDGDGRLDVIVQDGSVPPRARILRGLGDGTVAPLTSVQIASGFGQWRGFGDVNGDGAIDILIGGIARFEGGSTLMVTLHAAPLRISAQAASAAGGTDGATVTLSASVLSGHTNVSFEWWEGTTPLGSGASLSVRLPFGEHTLTVSATTPSGLVAVAAAAVTIISPPASEATVAGIRSTLDAKLDTTLSSRASQESIMQLEARASAIESGLASVATQSSLAALFSLAQSQLDAPISSRASPADLATLGAKLDQLQTSLPTGATLTSLTAAVTALSTTLTAQQTRLAIEQALARVDMVASFYLPTAYGGQLDIVRSIVLDVVDKNEAAGTNAALISRARRAIADGDAQKTAGDYRAAYVLYAGAYQAMGAPAR